MTIENDPQPDGSRDPYFDAIQQALFAARITRPTLIIDRARLNANIDRLVLDLPVDMGFRIVTKSLPSLGLLNHIRHRAGTDRLMTFNTQMLAVIDQELPDANQLLGKPVPAKAVEAFYDQLPVGRKMAAEKIQWLVDTPARLDQYAQIADACGVNMAINIELDIGLHRGGVSAKDELTDMLQKIFETDNLRFAGFMGYEAHLAKIPVLFGWRERAKRRSWEAYKAALKSAVEIFGDAAVDSSTRNVAGSPSFRLYKDTGIASEISVGSVLVKPTDFDLDMLTDFQPAAFIAAPVLKASNGTRIPALEFADAVKGKLNSNLAKTIFIHGGNWLARPVDPKGLRYNLTFGRSSNQEMLNGGPSVNLKPDDFIFLRPTQSEAVFLQFGDIAVYEDGAIVDRWPVFEMNA
jgi:D-serine deaminase-like pyridoxal phosphate-dependent protein